ncbi:lipopolysaccharide transport system permease protein [Winogradskyella eximia]|uniref:Transport permease protein n=1 Tax=Winogradskyella eximia TaxID=262006 RepID=A0A3D9GPQ2_9FLAO|nr:ABC transporter permease [Winogradskyella eximia]RED38200.1 lipopolysaccharide transport system permease protein [Winogradskyella eximia]
MKTAEEHWLYVISSKRKLIDFNFKEIWQYRDLLFLFVKRDIVTLYKQTVLGPLWYLIQPLFTALIFTLIFNNLADIPTGEGVPNFLFNLAGITSWNYFKECLIGTSDTFKKNENIFGKVYFPRVIMPMSVVVSNLLKFGIQLIVFVAFYIYFIYFTNKASAAFPQLSLIILPLLIFLMALLGLGFGMIISSMTTKYRDLTFLIQFGVQLLMYGSAVVYPMSYFKDKLPNYYWLIEWNPIAIIIESFRTMSFGSGTLEVNKLIYTVITSCLIFLIGLVIFNKTEKSFIDTI